MRASTPKFQIEMAKAGPELGSRPLSRPSVRKPATRLEGTRPSSVPICVTGGKAN